MFLPGRFQIVIEYIWIDIRAIIPGDRSPFDPHRLELFRTFADGLKKSVRARRVPN